MPTMRSPLVIGLTGSIGSGCTDAVAQKRLAQQHGLAFHSLSHMLKERARAAGRGEFGDLTLSPQREALQDFGDELRESDAAVLAQECAQHMRRQFDAGTAMEFVVDSIRNPEEVHYFRDIFPNFYLAAVLAPQQVRFQRVGEKLFSNDLGQFREKDLRDSGENQPKHGQRVRDCVDLADYLIDNSAQCRNPLEWENNLWSQVDSLVKLVRDPGSRKPSTDELYMEQAYAASRSSRCSKRHVGAAIVHRDAEPKEPRRTFRDAATFLISTGSNHVPGHLSSCKERGGGDPNYCTKDQTVLGRMRSLAACSKCGASLDPAQIITTSYTCPNPKCRAVVRDSFPGRQLDLCISVHAEEAAMLQVAKLGGTPLRGTTLYTTTFPCLLCAKKILEVGIEKVVYAEPYPMPESYDLLQEEEVGVRLMQFRGATARSFFRLFH